MGRKGPGPQFFAQTIVKVGLGPPLFQIKYYLFCFAESFSVDRPRKFERLSLYASKGIHTACITTFESNFIGRSTEIIRQSKIKEPLNRKR